MKKGFVFDLDGVLTDTAHFHFLAWKELADSLGITIDLAFNETLKGISRMDSLDRILAHGQQAERFSTEEKVALATKKNEMYLTLLEQLSTADVLPGVEAFLKTAAQKNIPCAVASASKNAPFILKKLQIDTYFQAVVDPETVANGKPDPEIFVKAAALIGLKPTEVVGFEDAQAGIDGLRAAGIYAVGLSTSLDLQQTQKQVTSFEELSVDELIHIA